MFICDKRGEWHSYNVKTETLNKLYIHNFYELGDNYVITNNKGLIGLLTPDGDIAIECKYTSITQLNEWMYALYDKADDCFVYNVHDNSFNYVGAMHVHSVVQIKNEFYLTYTDKDGKIRFINTINYMPVLNKYCDSIIENDFGTLKVQIDGKTGFLYL